MELIRKYRIKDDLNGDVWEDLLFDTWEEVRDYCAKINHQACKAHTERFGDPILYEPVSVQTRSRISNPLV